MAERLRAALIVNAHARAGERAFTVARRTLVAGSVELAVCARKSRREPLREALEQALDRRIPLIVLGGGDGTLHALAPRVAEAGATLGIVPLGTGNDFARSLEIPLDIGQACHVVAGGRTSAVDLGLLDGRPFLNAVTVGITTELTRRLTAGSKRLLGPVAYPVAALRAARHLRRFEAEVVVGNARFQGGGRLIDPEASATDRRLHGYVVLARHAGRLKNLLDLVGVGRGTRSGEHLRHASVWAFDGVRVQISTHPVRSLGADGELVGKTPAELSVLPARLRVRVPVQANLDARAG